MMSCDLIQIKESLSTSSTIRIFSTWMSILLEILYQFRYSIYKINPDISVINFIDLPKTGTAIC